MTTRRAWLLGLVAGFLVAAAAFFFARMQPEAETTAPAAATAASPAGTSEASASREQAQDDRPTSASGSAPPAGLTGLVALADAGDRQAACQVGYELLRCAHRQSRREAVMLSMLAQRERILEAEGDLAAANRLAGEQALMIEAAKSCDAIPAPLRNRGSHYLRQSALAGDPVAMLAYGLGHQFNPSGRGMVADTTFEAWREEAPAMLHRALLAGQPAAALGLAVGYHDDMGTSNSLIRDDAYRTAVYHLLSVRLFGTAEFRDWLDPLDAKQLQAARLEAGRLHADVFEGRLHPRSDMYLMPPMYYQPNRSGPPCGPSP